MKTSVLLGNQFPCSYKGMRSVPFVIIFILVTCFSNMVILIIVMNRNASEPAGT